MADQDTALIVFAAIMVLAGGIGKWVRVRKSKMEADAFLDRVQEKLGRPREAMEVLNRELINMDMAVISLAFCAFLANSSRFFGFLAFAALGTIGCRDPQSLFNFRLQIGDGKWVLVDSLEEGYRCGELLFSKLEDLGQYLDVQFPVVVFV